MTRRAMFLPVSRGATPSTLPVTPDFTRLSSVEARRQVVRLVHSGLSPYVVAGLFGLRVSYVFAACGEDLQEADHRGRP